MSSVQNCIDMSKGSLWWHGMCYCKYCCIHNIFYFANCTIKRHQNGEPYTEYHQNVWFFFFFFWILSQNFKLLWIFKVLTAGVKPKNSSRLLNCNHGCRLWSVTDREGRHTRVVWLKSQCLSKIWITRQVKIHLKSHLHFDCCQHFKHKWTNSHRTTPCLKF